MELPCSLFRDYLRGTFPASEKLEALLSDFRVRN